MGMRDYFKELTAQFHSHQQQITYDQVIWAIHACAMMGRYELTLEIQNPGIVAQLQAEGFNVHHSNGDYYSIWWYN